MTLILKVVGGLVLVSVLGIGMLLAVTLMGRRSLSDGKTCAAHA